MKEVVYSRLEGIFSCETVTVILAQKNTTCKAEVFGLPCQGWLASPKNRWI